MGQPYNSVAKEIAWFLLLLVVFLATATWIISGHYSFSSPNFIFQIKALLGRLEVQVTLLISSLLGAAFILVLMFANFVSRGLRFPRNTATFVVVLIGINILISVLPFLPQGPHWSDFRLKNLLPWLVVSAIMIVRNFMRSLMAWAHT